MRVDLSFAYLPPLHDKWAAIEKLYPPVDGVNWKYRITCLSCEMRDRHTSENKWSCDEWAEQHRELHPKSLQSSVTFARTIVKVGGCSRE